MMKWVTALWRLWVTWIARQHIELAHHEGRSVSSNLHLQQLTDLFKIALSKYEGKPVIAVNGKYDDPVVGFVLTVSTLANAHLPYPVVMDYVTMSAVPVLGRLYPWDGDLLTGLMMLSAEQRWKITQSIDQLGRLTLEHRHAPNDKPNLSYHALVEKLKANGFYDRLG
jgi:hypothetical protein